MSGDVNAEVIQKTQKILGKYIKKPPLTEKLLSKPPFRFLHDIVTTVIKDTGFLKGLFTDVELNSENVKDKDAKITFLNKLIGAIKTITKTDLSVRSSKVVAGLEPTETNLLLQAIGRALDKKLDSNEYVKTLKQDGKISDDKKNSKKTTNKEETKKSSKNVDDKNKKEVKKLIKKRSPSIETPKSTDRTKSTNSKESVIKKTVKRKDGVKDKSKRKETKPEESPRIDVPKKTENVVLSPRQNETIVVAQSNENLTKTVDDASKSDAPVDVNTKNKEHESIELSTNLADHTETPVETEKPIEKLTEDSSEKPSESHVFKRQNSAGLVRPKSARPKSGERDHIPSAKVKPLAPPAEMNITSSNMSTPSRPKSSLRPPSVRPSSARPGAPRLRPDSALPMQETVTMGNINVIVENVDMADDEETVVIQTVTELVEDTPSVAELKVPEENKGHLVEQILKQIEEEGEDVKRKVDIDWEEDALRGKEAANKEISQLRSFIQNLTKTANPLGKLLNYLHEDIEAMQSELQMWNSTKKQLLKEIEKQKKITSESNKPLLMQLEQIQDEIKKQENDIVSVRSNILRNDQRIKELLIK